MLRSLTGFTEEVAMQKPTQTLNCKSARERIVDVEEKMKDIYTNTARKDFGALTASARSELENYRVFFEADFILWKQFVGGMDYAYENNDPFFISILSGTNKTLNFSWAPGFKAELGYHLPHDGWDIDAKYTWLQASAASRSASPSDGTTGPLFPPFETPYTNSSSAKAHWNTSYSILNFELTKNYFLSRHFASKPFLGLKTAWIRQDMHTSYHDSPTIGSVVTAVGKNNFWGIGPWGGAKTTWFANAHWNFFSSSGASLMVGDFDVNPKISQNGTLLINLNQNIMRIVPMVQGEIGLGWETNLNCEKNHIAINLSYELQYWWRQNQLNHFGSSVIALDAVAPFFQRFSEDLGLNGMTLNILFDF